MMVINALSSLQKIAVSGTIQCGKQKVRTTVELREYDLFDPDDSLNITSAMNSFVVYGEESEIFSISPYLRVTYSCFYSHPSETDTCHSTDIDISKDMIGTLYDIGLIDLIKYPKKDVDYARVFSHTQRNAGATIVAIRAHSWACFLHASSSACGLRHMRTKFVQLVGRSVFSASPGELRSAFLSVLG
ncbi:hypothetical protein L596_013390 [Steinernema carpocapsae]|uniref:Uncharacterized protein n=1 Tax=Steinernema carpocapsae TaxID=34508 RepID=A0A4V6A527_STECR|nr:hypothetical protein L596_013390 [Steinernema carpocapsae]